VAGAVGFDWVGSVKDRRSLAGSVGSGELWSVTFGNGPFRRGRRVGSWPSKVWRGEVRRDLLQTMSLSGKRKTDNFL